MSTKEHAHDNRTVVSTAWWRGALAGFVSKSVVQPFGRWKLDSQVNGLVQGRLGQLDGFVGQVNNLNLSKSGIQLKFLHTVALKAHQGSYPASILMIGHLYGPRAMALELWKGNTLAATKSSLFFSNYIYINKKARHDWQLSKVQSATLAAFVAQTAVQPVDQWALKWQTSQLAKHQQLSSWNRAKEMIHVFTSLGQTDVVKQNKFHVSKWMSGAYRGYCATMVASVPYNTLLLVIQQELQEHYKWNKSAAGGFAGGLLTTCLMWQDTLRRVRQSSDSSSRECAKRLFTQGTSRAPTTANGVVKVAYGISRFYYGYLPTVCKSAVTNATRFLFVPSSVNSSKTMQSRPTNY